MKFEKIKKEKCSIFVNSTLVHAPLGPFGFPSLVKGYLNTCQVYFKKVSTIVSTLNKIIMRISRFERILGFCSRNSIK